MMSYVSAGREGMEGLSTMMPYVSGSAPCTQVWQEGRGARYFGGRCLR